MASCVVNFLLYFTLNFIYMDFLRPNKLQSCANANTNKFYFVHFACIEFCIYYKYLPARIIMLIIIYITRLAWLIYIQIAQFSDIIKLSCKSHFILYSFMLVILEPLPLIPIGNTAGAFLSKRMQLICVINADIASTQSSLRALYNAIKCQSAENPFILPYQAKDGAHLWD